MGDHRTRTLGLIARQGFGQNLKLGLTLFVLRGLLFAQCACVCSEDLYTTKAEVLLVLPFECRVRWTDGVVSLSSLVDLYTKEKKKMLPPWLPCCVIGLSAVTQ